MKMTDSSRTVNSSFLSRCKAELLELGILTLPSICSQLMVVSLGFVSTIFCGHLGKRELAGAALATAIFNVMGTSIGIGMTAACDTLISQTFGAGNLHKIGVIVQRSVLILLLTCFPCWAVLINTQNILLLFHQEPEVASLAQQYVMIILPGLPVIFMHYVLAKYMQNQGIIWPQLFTGVLVNIINIIISYVFIFILNLGLSGSALAVVISEFCLGIILFLLIWCKGLHKATWGGWSKECLEDWDSFVHLAIPSMIMMCVEWWTYEVGGFLAGLISEVQLDCQSILYQLGIIANSFPLGFGIAGSVRVGIALGAGEVDSAKFSAKMAISCGVLVSLFLAIVFGGTRNYIPYIFTNSVEIKDLASTALVLFAPFTILDGLGASASGVIRGAGEQKIGAIFNLLGFYGIGFPVGIPLMFAAKLGVFGMWIGFVSGALLQSTIILLFVLKMNWNKAALEAQRRAGGYTTRERKRILLRDDTSKSQEDVETMELLNIEEHFSGEEEEEEEEEKEDVVEKQQQKKMISYESLILRRTLALVFMALILVVGILVYALIPYLLE